MVDNRFLNKNEQRAYLKNIRQSIPDKLRQEKSLSIAKQLISTSEYIDSKSVMLYISFGSEVITNAIIDSVIRRGKHLIVPLCNSNDYSITAYEIYNLSQLYKGNYGILEPDPKLIDSGILKSVDKSDIDIVVVPGLGFDKFGYRVGYGKGYYDRYLSDFGGMIIGLCYAECLLDNIYHDKFDIRVDRVITDKI